MEGNHDPLVIEDWGAGGAGFCVRQIVDEVSGQKADLVFPEGDGFWSALGVLDDGDIFPFQDLAGLGQEGQVPKLRQMAFGIGHVLNSAQGKIQALLVMKTVRIQPEASTGRGMKCSSSS